MSSNLTSWFSILKSGQPENEFLPALIDSDLAFVFYPSHSNGKTRDEIDFKKLKSFDPEIAFTPSDDDVRRYYASLGYHQSIVESIKVTKGAVLPDPFATTKPNEKPKEIFVEVSHAPITKCRIIFLLDKPIEFSDDWKEAAETERDWKAVYNHVGKEFGLQFDRFRRGFELGVLFWAMQTQRELSRRVWWIDGAGAAAMH